MPPLGYSPRRRLLADPPKLQFGSVILTDNKKLNGLHCLGIPSVMSSDGLVGQCSKPPSGQPFPYWRALVFFLGKFFDITRAAGGIEVEMSVFFRC